MKKRVLVLQRFLENKVWTLPSVPVATFAHAYMLDSFKRHLYTRCLRQCFFFAKCSNIDIFRAA